MANKAVETKNEKNASLFSISKIYTWINTMLFIGGKRQIVNQSGPFTAKPFEIGM